MSVYKWKKYDLRPKRKTLGQKILGKLVEHHNLVTVVIMGAVFIVTLAVLQSQAQADYLLPYGSA